ncbi:hypothetical protein MWU65_07955 [Cellulophaga sp. F20128]|nr:hypothetical protein [Cellulophaga sp. F20128]MCK0157106.1 hypothetical protein [Cellulophaga sp. F20128]
MKKKEILVFRIVRKAISFGVIQFALSKKIGTKEQYILKNGHKKNGLV